MCILNKTQHAVENYKKGKTMQTIIFINEYLDMVDYTSLHPSI